MTTVPSALTRVHWFHPEWVAVAVAAAGWALLLGTLREAPMTLLLPSTHQSVGDVLTHAAVMTAAMMSLLVLRPVHDVAVASLWSRRYRAVVGYLIGYLLPWAALGGVALLVLHQTVGVVGALPMVVALSAVAVAVAAARDHQRRVVSCSASRPLRLSGWSADRDCVAAGARMAGRCVAATWALMLVVIAQGGLAVMAAGTTVLLLERRRHLRGRRASWATLGVGLLAVLVTTAAHQVGVVPGPPAGPHGGH